MLGRFRLFMKRNFPGIRGSRLLVVSARPNPLAPKVPNLPSFRSALLIYALLFFALIHPFWMFGEAIVPYRLSRDIGVAAAPPSSHTENMKFSDYWVSTIPGMREHF